MSHRSSQQGLLNKQRHNSDSQDGGPGFRGGGGQAKGGSGQAGRGGGQARCGSGKARDEDDQSREASGQAKGESGNARGGKGSRRGGRGGYGGNQGGRDGQREQRGQTGMERGGNNSARRDEYQRTNNKRPPNQNRPIQHGYSASDYNQSQQYHQPPTQNQQWKEELLGNAPQNYNQLPYQNPPMNNANFPHNYNQPPFFQQHPDQNQQMDGRYYNQSQPPYHQPPYHNQQIQNQYSASRYNTPPPYNQPVYEHQQMPNPNAPSNFIQTQHFNQQRIQGHQRHPGNVPSYKEQPHYNPCLSQFQPRPTQQPHVPPPLMRRSESNWSVNNQPNTQRLAGKKSMSVQNMDNIGIERNQNSYEYHDDKRTPGHTDARRDGRHSGGARPKNNNRRRMNRSGSIHNVDSGSDESDTNHRAHHSTSDSLERLDHAPQQRKSQEGRSIRYPRGQQGRSSGRPRGNRGGGAPGRSSSGDRQTISSSNQNVDTGSDKSAYNRGAHRPRSDSLERLHHARQQRNVRGGRGRFLHGERGRSNRGFGRSRFVEDKADDENISDSASVADSFVSVSDDDAVEDKTTSKQDRKINGSHRGPRRIGAPARRSRGNKQKISARASTESISSTETSESGKKEDHKTSSFEENVKHEDQEIDVFDISLITLRNRRKRYQRKVSEMTKSGANAEEIAKIKKKINFLTKTLSLRTSSELSESKKEPSETDGMSNSLMSEKQNNLQSIGGDDNMDDNEEDDDSEASITASNSPRSNRKNEAAKRHRTCASKIGKISFAPGKKSSKEKTLLKEKQRKQNSKMQAASANVDAERTFISDGSEEEKPGNNVENTSDDASENIKNDTTQKIKSKKKNRKKQQKDTEQEVNQQMKHSGVDAKKTPSSSSSLQEKSRITGSEYQKKLDKFDKFQKMIYRTEEAVEDNTAGEQKFEKSGARPKDNARPLIEEIPNKRNDSSVSASNVQIGPDEKTVFEYLIKHMNGRCTPDELMNNSGLFDRHSDIQEWLERHHNIIKVVRRNDKIISVFAFRKAATYCMDYVKRKPCEGNCGRYHICKDYLSGFCHFGDKCNFSHDLLDGNNNNLKLSKSYHFYGRFTKEEIATIMRMRFPHLCNEWLNKLDCQQDNCPHLHLCKLFVVGRCPEGDGCPQGHSLDSPHNKSIAEALMMTTYSPSMFRNLIYVIREHNERSQARVRRNTGEIDPGANAKLIVSDTAPFICDKHLMGMCSKANCPDFHNPDGLPYIWQVKVDDHWINLDQSESIERSFCNKDVESYTYEMPGDTGFRFYIHFETYIRGYVICEDKGERQQEIDARRLTTDSFSKDPSNTKTFLTQWRWYYKNDLDEWILFTVTKDQMDSDADALQYVMETKFQHQQGEYYYSRDNYNFMYCIFFEYMQQRNLNTDKVRDIIRRPEMVTRAMVANKTCPKALTVSRMIDTILPTDWVPWDIVQPFEIVSLRKNQREYINIFDQFYTTLKKTTHTILNIYRVQNHELWEMFKMKEKKMKERLGNEQTLQARQLFHGTHSIEVVRGICINNFDPRLSGQNATVYGNGSYFARDAKYSHEYTSCDANPFPMIRYMFLADVLVGDYTKGDKTLRRPPEKEGRSHQLYDSCVDKMDRPSIFVIFERTQFYPTYLIEYDFIEDKKRLNQNLASGSTTVGTFATQMNTGQQLHTSPHINTSALMTTNWDVNILTEMNMGSQMNRSIPGASSKHISDPPPLTHRAKEEAGRKPDNPCSIQ